MAGMVQLAGSLDPAAGMTPGEVIGHVRLGADHHGKGRFDLAEAQYRAALDLDPGCFDALHLLGLVCHQLGRHEAAVGYMRQALEIDPTQAVAHSNLGLALAALKRPGDAIASFDRSLELRPGHAQTLLSRGIAQLESGAPQGALDSFDLALSIVPGNPALLCNRGNALQALGRHDEALASYDSAIALKDDFAEAYCNRANPLRGLGRMSDALASTDRALSLKPDFAGAMVNRAIALRELDRHPEALVECDRALALRPGDADALCNRGIALQEMGRCAEALQCYAGALASDPGHAESHWNEGLCRLTLGEFARGWEKYEWRWKTAQRRTLREFSEPLWTGRQDLRGRTILLHAEQGLGDTLQFCRYARMVAGLGATVVLEVQKPLKALLSSLEGAAQVIARGDPLPAFDFHCPLLSLPLAFGTTLADIPADVPYLRCDPGEARQWAGRLEPRTAPRVGLVWRSASAKRSVSLEKFLRLASGRAQFFVLQKDLAPDEQRVLDSRRDILQVGAGLRNFADAPIVDLMDLIITVDTSMAHLAGALGRKTWVLLPSCGEWRWLLERSDSPWYPRTRLFRSRAPGDWDAVLREVGEALDEELGRPG